MKVWHYLWPLNLKSSVQNSYFTRIISIIQEFGCLYERLYCISFQQKEKKIKKAAFRGLQRIVAGTERGRGGKCYSPGNEWGGEKRPGPRRTGSLWHP